uniref:Uncharacterized protein n=1 Tax=Steinernema glaseri TaxID=37863 RepID=A0A1I8A2T4_9BILA
MAGSLAENFILNGMVIKAKRTERRRATAGQTANDNMFWGVSSSTRPPGTKVNRARWRCLMFRQLTASREHYAPSTRTRRRTHNRPAFLVRHRKIDILFTRRFICRQHINRHHARRHFVRGTSEPFRDPRQWE